MIYRYHIYTVRTVRIHFYNKKISSAFIPNITNILIH
jgi:hypothetical protein